MKRTLRKIVVLILQIWNKVLNFYSSKEFNEEVTKNSAFSKILITEKKAIYGSS